MKRKRRDPYARRARRLWVPSDKVTLKSELAKRGIRPSPPSEVDDEALPQALRALIESLAEFRIYLESTDHLSDRDLYTQLFGSVLTERREPFELNSKGGCFILFGADGSSGDEDAYLRYYADDDEREHWLARFPDTVLPPSEPLPYNRDCTLPWPRPQGECEECEDTRPE